MVIPLRDFKEGNDRIHGAGFRIFRTVIYVSDSGLNDGPGTHHARLEGDIQRTVFQPPGMKLSTRRGNRHEFGVFGHTLSFLTSIVSAANDRTVLIDDDGSDRYFIFRFRFTGKP